MRSVLRYKARGARGAASGAAPALARVAFLPALTLLLFLAGHGTAGAAQFHPFKFALDGTGTTAGQFGTVASVAVEQTSGSVYVFDRGKAVIDKFDSAGNPENFSSTGTSSLKVLEACPGFAVSASRLRTDIAVDSSGGPNQGNIYVASYLGGGVCAFDSTGALLYRLPSVEPIDGACGVETDALGRLWVGTFALPGALQFSAGGIPPTLVTIVPKENMCRLAVGSAGNIYLVGWFGAGAGQGVERWTVAGFQQVIRPSGYDVGVDPATDLVYVSDTGRVVSYTPNGTKVAEIGVGIPYDLTGQGKLTDPLATAVRGATGDVYVADTATARVNVYGPLATFPDVTTGEATSVRRTTATVGVAASPDGGDVTDCYVEWGTTPAYGQVTGCGQPTPYDEPTETIAEITGLVPGTTYHYRAVAENAAGPNFGASRTFTTPFVNGIETGDATAVTRSAATLNGEVDPSGIETSFFFQWGTDQAYGNTTPVPPGEGAGSGNGAIPVATPIGGLALGTTYHYRLVASNGEGTTFGEDRTFATLGAVKAVETGEPSDLTQATASLNGTLDPDGLPTNYYFEWGPDSSYGNTTSPPPGEDAGSGTGQTAVSAAVGGLLSYRTYHYRLVATNQLGTTYGADMVLTTEAPLLPSIGGTESREVSARSATLGAEVTPGFGETVYRFQYGLNTGYESRTNTSSSIGADNIPHPISVTVENLSPNATYHYRAVAINFSGVTYGPDRTFTTQGPPRVVSGTATNVTQSAATIAVTINSGNSPTTFHVEYGEVGGGLARTPESGVVGADGGDHSSSIGLNGLSPGTNYRFRVVARNGVGEVAGGEQILTTHPAPPPPITQTPCRAGFARKQGRCVKKGRPCRGRSVRRNGKCVRKRKAARKARKTKRAGYRG